MRDGLKCLSPLFHAIRGCFALALWLEPRTLPLQISQLQPCFSMPAAVLTAQQTMPPTPSTAQHSKKSKSADTHKLNVQDCETLTVEKFPESLHSADIGLDRQGADNVQAAKVVAAWEAAVGRTNTQRQLDAEQRTAGLPTAIPRGMFVTMRRAWEANLEPGQTVSPSELPAKSFLEWRNAPVDDVEFLAEVSSQQEGSAQTDDHIQADFAGEGSKAVAILRILIQLEQGVPQERGSFLSFVPLLL